MGNLRQFRSLTPGLNLGATTAALALAIVFALTIVTTDAAHAQSFQVIYTFTGGPDGAQPYAGLTMDRGGNLYGTTSAGNEGSNWGNVYQMRHRGAGWTFAQLHLFDGTLSSRVAIGPDGSLYGASPNNIAGYAYGYIFNLRHPVSAICSSIQCPWNVSVIYGFSGGADGASPRYGDLTFDQVGNFYGTTSVGGSGNGVVYEMMPSGGGWSEQPLYAFAGSPDGANPFGGLVFDKAGNLYGMTTQGGSTGNGTVFELSPSGGGWAEKVLYNFQGGSDGSFPTAGLIFDQSGNLYGTTSNGGTGGGGTVFELTPSGGSWTYNLLYSFTGGTKCGPWGTLTLDGAGNLYGTTVCDGANNDGNVFELTQSGGSWTYGSLYDFTGGTDGRRPYGNVTFDTAGNIYGTASRGGTHDAGVVWEITP